MNVGGLNSSVPGSTDHRMASQTSVAGTPHPYLVPVNEVVVRVTQDTSSSIIVRSGSFTTGLGCPRHVRVTPDRERGEDIPDRQLRAIRRHTVASSKCSRVPPSKDRSA